jgi:hypothetical protein
MDQPIAAWFRLTDVAEVVAKKIIAWATRQWLEPVNNWALAVTFFPALLLLHELGSNCLRRGPHETHKITGVAHGVRAAARHKQVGGRRRIRDAERSCRVHLIEGLRDKL